VPEVYSSKVAAQYELVRNANVDPGVDLPVVRFLSVRGDPYIMPASCCGGDLMSS
jgi:hypothetical protein